MAEADAALLGAVIHARCIFMHAACDSRWDACSIPPDRQHGDPLEKLSNGDLSGRAAKGYMKEEGLDQRVIFVAPTTSIQAMLGGDVQFTGAGSSALVSMARGNTPLKVIVATNDRVLQWFVTRPEITSPKDLKGKKDSHDGGSRHRNIHD
jgi:NMT1/THI5 like